MLFFHDENKEQPMITKEATAFRNDLVHVLSGDERILGVGQTGDIHAPLVAGKSDADLFMICTSVPRKKSAVYAISS